MRKFFTLAAIALLSATTSIAQNVTVNPGAGSYATLKAAFDAINAGTHTGAVTVTFSSNTTETASASLNASGSGSASYTSVVINPSGNVTVSGNLAAPLVNLNGADNVTIDGLNSGGNSLTFSNTSTSPNATTSTIRFINDASNNAITNCTILGSNTRAANTTTVTGNILLSTGTTTGNDNNIISNNNIGSAGSNLSSRGIASFGSTGASNSGNTVSNNNIFDIFNITYSAAINLNDFNDGWMITGNRIYQSATRAGTGTGIHYGIWIDGSTVNAESFTITNNIIGYSTSTQAGTYKITGTATTFQGITVTLKPSANASNISNNTIAAVTVANTTTTANYGINVNVTATGGVPVTINNNIIEGLTSTGNIYAIAFTGPGINRTSVITGNMINNFTLSTSARCYGILYNGGDGGQATTISNNTLADIHLDGTASGSALNSPALACIYVASGPTIITHNTIGSQVANFSVTCIQATGSTSSFDLLGIFVKGTDSQTVSNNNIGGLYAENVNATSGTARIFAMRNSSSGQVVFSNNLVGGTIGNSIQLNSAFGGAGIWGIYSNAGVASFDSNTLRNMLSGAGTGTAANSSMLGIYNASNNATNITNNTIHNLSTPGTHLIGIGVGTGTTTVVSGNVLIGLSNTSTAMMTEMSGIQVSGGATAQVFKNKVVSLLHSAAFTNAGGVNGILLSGGTNATVYNNIVGDLTAPFANSIDAVRGISITATTPNSTFNIYHNTVYVNAASNGTDFGSSALFHAASTDATTASMDLKNNILVNTSTGSGAGIVAALKRWGGVGTAADLANYATTSNNNIFYAGTPGSANVIYSDSVNADQLLSAFMTRVAPRETASYTELPPFPNVNTTDANYLHIDAAIPTLVESRGMSIAGINDDYDGDARQGTAGYTGTGTAPDIGADEGNFISMPFPVTLVNFRGARTGKVNRLEWSTETETNNRHFELQRSVDGKKFSTLALLASKAMNGNSNITLHYSYVDEIPFQSANYYRLMQVDKDGRTSHSQVVVVKGEITGAVMIARLYPNPATDVLNLVVASPAGQDISIAITDLSGKVVLRNRVKATNGDNHLSINVSTLAPGSYVLRLACDNGCEGMIGRFVK